MAQNFRMTGRLPNESMIAMDETTISRGFRSKRQEQTPKNRLPPGQYVTTDFPVLSAGPTPQIKLGDWTFALQLGGSLLGKWNWAEFEALPQTTIKRDIHCVTKWSKFDTTWQGVTFDDLLKAVGLAEPAAPYIMAHCDGGYTTNVPVADLIAGQGMIATRNEGLPIPPAHGGPARLLVPHLYFWKSANGSADSVLWKRISPASGSRLATTIMATPGKSSDMTATETPARPVRRLKWQLAQVREIVVETYRVRSLLLHVANWQGHLSGQPVAIRLTAGHGYQAQRSYSIASPHEDALLTLTVERVDNGEVSPYLVDDLRAGDQFELRGPIGGYFVWTAAMGGPLYLIAGGSGIVPLMAMLRHRERRNGRAPALLLYSSRSLEDVIYREELDMMARGNPDLRVVHTLTRKQPAGWMGRRGRIDKALLAQECFPPEQNPKIFVCGSTPFVEDVSRFLVELGYDPLTIKTER